MAEMTEQPVVCEDGVHRATDVLNIDERSRVAVCPCGLVRAESEILQGAPLTEHVHAWRWRVLYRVFTCDCGAEQAARPEGPLVVHPILKDILEREGLHD